MKGLYAVYRKEMSHYFVSPIAYIVVGIFLLLTGCLLYTSHLNFAVLGS